MLFELLRDHETSRVWLAMVLGVHEKQVRKMLGAEISIPVTIVDCLPEPMRADYIDRLALLDGRKRVVNDIARLSLVDAIAAQRRLTDRIAELAEGAR